ncbi:hypothetical protein EXIGLDRAFT_784280 [Exidia glandulosa HHB12029]|uniref:Uncharacterized protein n=1 Tax=Exidia glandulosa HHB12029 TaxID=1314781 RepID=A0A166MK25_EXIGL|nr:hypothetical protein EXIGLDRAFT_784280 [Exidia glandulosa HHB12029]
MSSRLVSIISGIANLRFLAQYPFDEVIYDYVRDLEQERDADWTFAVDTEWFLATREGRSDSYCYAREALLAATVSLVDATNKLMVVSMEQPTDKDKAGHQQALVQLESTWRTAADTFLKAAHWVRIAESPLDSDPDDFQRKENPLIATDYVVPTKTAAFVEHEELGSLITPTAPGRKRRRGNGTSPSPDDDAIKDGMDVDKHVKDGMDIDTHVPKPVDVNELPLPKAHLMAYENVRDHLIALTTEIGKVHVATAQCTDTVLISGKRLGQVARYLSMILILFTGTPEQISSQLPAVREIVSAACDSTPVHADGVAFLDKDQNYATQLLGSFGFAREEIEAGKAARARAAQTGKRGS